MVLGASLEEGREEGGGEKVKKGKEETKEKPLVSLSLFLSAPQIKCVSQYWKTQYWVYGMSK